MTFLSDGNGLRLRAWYNNLIYALMLLFGGLILLSLNQDVQTSTATDAEYLPAYQNCDLVNATKEAPCFALSETNKDALQQLFNISVAIVVINVLTTILGIMGHYRSFISFAQMAQYPITLVNLGLFAGLWAWFDSIAGLTEKVNFKENVMTEDYSIYALAIIGTLAGVVDALFGVTLAQSYCSDKGGLWGKLCSWNPARDTKL